MISKEVYRLFKPGVMNSLAKEFIGEAIGTFILVFSGCSAIMISIVHEGSLNIFSIAAIWGIAVAVSINLFGRFCSAHFNPAVSLGMAIIGKLDRNRLLSYFLAQMAGATTGAVSLYYIVCEANKGI